VEKKGLGIKGSGIFKEREEGNAEMRHLFTKASDGNGQKEEPIRSVASATEIIRHLKGGGRCHHNIHVRKGVTIKGPACNLQN